MSTAALGKYIRRPLLEGTMITNASCPRFDTKQSRDEDYNLTITALFGGKTKYLNISWNWFSYCYSKFYPWSVYILRDSATITSIKLFFALTELNTWDTPSCVFWQNSICHGILSDQNNSLPVCLVLATLITCKMLCVWLDLGPWLFLPASVASYRYFMRWLVSVRYCMVTLLSDRLSLIPNLSFSTRVAYLGR